MSHHHDHDHCHGEATDHDHDHSHDAEADTGLLDSLFGKVAIDKSWCLNESIPGSIQTVFKSWDNRLDTSCFVESDSDEELLIHVVFTGMVKLKSLFVWGGASSSAPRSLRVFANRDDLDFDNVTDAEPTQEIELVMHEQPPEYAVRTAKFNSTRSLTLHVPDNFGADQTTVYYLAFRGEWTEMSDAPVVSVYEMKPNVADHKTKNESLAHHSIM